MSFYLDHHFGRWGDISDLLSLELGVSTTEHKFVPIWSAATGDRAGALAELVKAVNRKIVLVLQPNDNTLVYVASHGEAITFVDATGRVDATATAGSVVLQDGKRVKSAPVLTDEAKAALFRVDVKSGTLFVGKLLHVTLGNMTWKQTDAANSFLIAATGGSDLKMCVLERQVCPKPKSFFTLDASQNANVLARLIEKCTKLPLGVEQINVIMVGGCGVGKSTAINNVLGAVNGETVNKATTGSQVKSLTQKFRGYACGKLKVELRDTAGFSAEAAGAYGGGTDWVYILDGNVVDTDLRVPITRSTLDFVSDPKLNDRVHCVCICLAHSALHLHKAEIALLKKLAHDRDIAVVVFVTKIDECEPITSDKPSLTQYSAKLNETKALAKAETGVDNVALLRSFKGNVYCDDEVRTLVLNALELIVSSSVDKLNNIADQQERRARRHPR